MSTTKPESGNRHIILKTLLAILIAFILFLAIFFAIDYSHYARDKSPYRTLFVPRLELSVFQVTMLTADKTDMVGRMLIHNPLPFNLRADSLQYQIYISGVEVIKSTYEKSLNIKRWDSTWVDLPVTAYNDKLLTVLNNAEKEGKDSLDYEVKTYFGTQLLGHRDFHLDIKTRQPTVYIPGAKLTAVEYDSLNGEGVTMYIHATITNKNKFPLNFKDLNFRVAIANDAWVKGSKPGEISIPDSSVVPLVLPIRISFKQIGKSLGPLIKHGKNTDFKFEATLKLVSDNNAMKNSVIVIKDESAIHEIVKLAKDEGKKAKEKKAKETPDQKKEDKAEKKKNKIHFGKRKKGEPE